MEEEVTRLRLRVSPGAARSELARRHGDAWMVVELRGLQRAEAERRLEAR